MNKGECFISTQKRLRINNEIRAKSVLLIVGDQKPKVETLDRALFLAREQGLDLVEFSPDSTPPVCRIVDFGKYLYEQQKKHKDSNHKSVKLKEIRLSAVMAEHDLTTKVNQLRNFLTKGIQVKLTLQYYGRQAAHPEEGKRILDKVITDVKDVGTNQSPPSKDGKFLTVKMIPVVS